MIESVRHNRDSTGIGVESIDLVLKTWSRAKVLDPAVDSICEIDVFVLRMDGYIIE